VLELASYLLRNSSNAVLCVSFLMRARHAPRRGHLCPQSLIWQWACKRAPQHAGHDRKYKERSAGSAVLPVVRYPNNALPKHGIGK